jgi:predicted lysophospholipase L1 biosynthesis ABC-type transport system permease subunit
VFGLVFPVLALFTAVAVFVRIVLLALPAARAVTRRGPMAVALATRRVSYGRVATAGLLAAAAVAAGVLGYAATMERSMFETLEAKAATFVGADTATRVSRDAPVPGDFDGRSTQVGFHPQVWVDVDGRRESASLLAIDPETFHAAAFWDPTFADRSFDDVVAALTDVPEEGPVPAVVLGGASVGDRVEIGITEGRTRRLDVRPLSGVEAFPGMRRAEMTVVVAASSIADLDLRGRTELWVRGDHDETIATLDRAGVVNEEPRRASDVADGAAFRTISWTFGFMQALGIVAGLLVVGAVFVHLDARHRERLLAHAFLRRMGASERQHRLALGVELAASVLVGCWAGLAIAVGAAWAAHGRMDPVPLFAPAPVLRPAVGVIAAAGVVALVLVVVGAVVSQRRLETDDPVEVLRAGA